MTKEELIVLSDLNREDNIKYISSEAQGIAIVLNSDRYAPTLCKLERAYICGRRKSEKQIVELSKHILELQVDKGDLIDKSRELEEQIKKCKEEIIKALKECSDYEWLPVHNGKAKYLYLQTIIDIVNEKFEEIKEND